MIYPNIRYNFYWHELGQCYRFYYFFETKKRLAGFSEQFCQKQTEILYISYWRVQYSLLWYMSIRLSGSSACLCVHLYLEVFANLFFFLLWYARTNTDKHIHAQTHTYEHTHTRARAKHTHMKISKIWKQKFHISGPRVPHAKNQPPRSKTVACIQIIEWRRK